MNCSRHERRFRGRDARLPGVAAVDEAAGAVDRAVAPLGLTPARYAPVASLYGTQRAGERPSRRRRADHTGLEPLCVSTLARAR